MELSTMMKYTLIMYKFERMNLQIPKKLLTKLKNTKRDIQYDALLVEYNIDVPTLYAEWGEKFERTFKEDIIKRDLRIVKNKRKQLYLKIKSEKRKLNIID